MEKVQGIPLSELTTAMTPEKKKQFRKEKIYREAFNQGAQNLNLMSSTLEQEVEKLNRHAKEVAEKA